MSSKKGKKPAHQNKYAFHHNKGSKRTKEILGLPNEGLCYRCTEIIEWKKRYRKYKPLTVAKRCNGCGEKTVKRAYHELCAQCAETRAVCAKCRESRGVMRQFNAEERAAEEAQALELDLSMMSERQRRTKLRQLERNDDEVDDDDGDDDVDDDDDAVDDDDDDGVRDVDNVDSVDSVDEDDIE